MTYERRFREVFAENVRRRSRTAHGQDKGKQTSSVKRQLLLSGDALAARTAENVDRLITDVWANRLRLDEGAYPRDMSPELMPIALRSHCERWYDIASDGLVDSEGYEEAFRKFDADIARVDRFRPLPYGMDRRFRIWTPEYTTLKVPPMLIAEHMRDFYCVLAASIRRRASARFPPSGNTDDTGHDLARVMAYADVMMDGEIHPWLDGCSRVSTALLMWIAGSFGTVPPLFAPTKAEHYETIRDLDAHERYIKACVERTLSSAY